MEDFWKAIIEWMVAQTELNKAIDEFQGYSWDYHFHTDIEEVRKLKDKAEQELNSYIDKRVRAILNERNENE